MKKSLDLIKKYVIPVTSATYDAKKQVWYIGYNQTYGVYNGLTWTQKQIEDDLIKQVTNIRRLLDHNFYGYLTDLHVEALTSLIHDIGVETFLQSEIPKYIKLRKYTLIANSFMLYNRDGRIASVKKSNRRRKEQLLFEEGTKYVSDTSGSSTAIEYC